MDTLIVKSYAKEEAIKEAERRGFTTIVDITRYWSKLGRPNVNNLKSEIIDTMRRKRIIDKKGFAYMVVLKDNSKTLRKRRFKCVNRSTGQKQYYLSVIEIRTEEDQLVGRFTSKREAIIFARGISKKYNIRTIPVFMAIKDDGTEIDRFVGVKSADAIKQWIDFLNVD